MVSGILATVAPRLKGAADAWPCFINIAPIPFPEKTARLVERQWEQLKAPQHIGLVVGQLSPFGPDAGLLQRVSLGDEDAPCLATGTAEIARVRGHEEPGGNIHPRTAVGRQFVGSGGAPSVDGASSADSGCSITIGKRTRSCSFDCSFIFCSLAANSTRGCEVCPS